jgi:RNA polymerase sigma-70 factor, ECF subfamily
MIGEVKEEHGTRRADDSGPALMHIERIEKSYDRVYEEAGSTLPFLPLENESQAYSETLSISNEPSETETTEEELMQAVCMGDKSAYQMLVKKHLKSISHYAYRLLGNQKDTEDISQEVFLRLWTNAPKFKAEKSKLTTWLHRIAHNLCIDHLRKHGRVQTQETFDDEADESGAENLESNDAQSEEMNLLRDTISALPENQRSALSLCHFQGFSNKQAAAIMNISVKALESTLARAKRSLREKLASE